MSYRSVFLLALVVLVGVPVGVRADEEPILSDRDRCHPVIGRRGMVATQEAKATKVGVEILAKGGNAVDAAVGIGFTLAVTLPRAGNLGGGGFMLVHDAKKGETVAIDYRETAPAGATRDMYLDEAGDVVKDRCRFSRLAVGVPGTVAGLVLALERYGTMPLAEVIAPAIRYAEEGIVVTPDLADSLARAKKRLKDRPETMRIFYGADGEPPGIGDRLRQPDLAASLRLLAKHGPKAFYEGAIADRIAADMEAHDGLITKADLKAYRPVVRQPVRGTYRGYEIVSMPPPSSGGVHLIQLLNVLEGEVVGARGAGSAASIHLLAEAMKHAYADRSRYLGDPDFIDVPVEGLVSKEYAKRIRWRIDPYETEASRAIRPGTPVDYESDETTHFSVMDAAGNAVSNTYTLNFSYGSGIVAKGTGILLNNEMDDFSAKPGVPNAYGLVGGEANCVAPRKRPLSSMTPTLVFRDGKPFLATGSPGGSRIISTTLQLIVNVIDHGMNVAEATSAPRVHHQWLPDELRVETGFSPDTLFLLRRLGHRVVVKDAMGCTQSVMRTEDGLFRGASDRRRAGGLALGP